MPACPRTAPPALSLPGSGKTGWGGVLVQVLELLEHQTVHPPARSVHSWTHSGQAVCCPCLCSFLASAGTRGPRLGARIPRGFLGSLTTSRWARKSWGAPVLGAALPSQ